MAHIRAVGLVSSRAKVTGLKVPAQEPAQKAVHLSPYPKGRPILRVQEEAKKHPSPRWDPIRRTSARPPLF